MKTDNTPKHTPEFWIDDDDFLAHGTGDNYQTVSGPITQKYSAFIVKACNEHESLTDKVQELNDLNADQFLQITNLQAENKKLKDALILIKQQTTFTEDEGPTDEEGAQAIIDFVQSICDTAINQ